MKKLKRSIVSMLLVIILILSSVVPVSAASTEPSSYSTQYNSGHRGVVCTTLDGTSADDYYTGSYTYDSLEELSSSELLTALRSLMTSTHTYISSYDDCHYKADRTDCQDGDGTVLLLYTSYAATMSQWNGWNREHVWPKSLGGNTTTGGGADLHHIRPSDASVNSSRGNKKYGESGSDATSKYGNNPATGYLGGTYNSTYFEPLDCVKGDVARICLYVYVRWGSNWGATSITSVFQSVDLLLEWCELDPVDTWEMGRNEVVESIQGNRNVFIDYPELAWLLFDREVPDDMVTPSGEAMGGACAHESVELKGKVEATCTINGYTGDIYCNDCGRTVTAGTVITASHDWSEWKVNEADDTETRTCSVCGETQSECRHSETEIRNKTEATCTDTGYSGDTYCKSCGDKLSSGATASSKGHSWGDWQINETDDTKVRTCSSCGITQSECQHSKTEIRNKTEATCTGMGYSGDTHCKSCGDKLSSGSAISSKGHSWGEWQIGTTEKSRTCGSCGTTQTQAIDATECQHTRTEQRDAVAATCGSAGYSGDTYCLDCDEKLAKGKTVPATAIHSWSELTVTAEPTAASNGEGVHTCIVCGIKKTVIVYYEAAEIYGSVEEEIIAIITKNAFDALLAGYLAGA